jgi:ABC-type uncharacterized transport system permease subunit
MTHRLPTRAQAARCIGVALGAAALLSLTTALSWNGNVPGTGRGFVTRAEAIIGRERPPWAHTPIHLAGAYRSSTPTGN